MAEATLDRFKDPAYTGENRCLPCTTVNVAIAVVVAAGLSTVSVQLAGVFLLVAVLAIWFKGYLVPGTPEFTKRYLPPWVLRWFGKEPLGAKIENAAMDPIPALRALDAIEPCDDIDDECLNEEFAAEWKRAIVDLEESDRVLEALSPLVDIPAEDLEITETDRACIVSDGSGTVAKWPSRAALLVDLAADPVFRDRDTDWDDLSLATRGHLLNGIRVFLEECPYCQTQLTLSSETYTSCCSETEVYRLGCPNCDALLLETQAA